ncbi:MAG: 50S ribosomal protein L22 [candidate division Zixibacteria bacterium]|nr:50S ribosomal protein L22 [candidate division Zixibacteria bacterium]
MEFRARSKYIKMSARKIRRVADLIRGKDVEHAMEALYFIPKAAADPILRTLKSATANAMNSEDASKVKPEDLYVKEIRVDGGPIMKRIRPAPMGRAYRIRKRTAHIDMKLAVRDDRIEEIQHEEKKKKKKRK